MIRASGPLTDVLTSLVLLWKVKPTAALFHSAFKR